MYRGVRAQNKSVLWCIVRANCFLLLFVLVDFWIIGDTEYQFSRIFWSWYVDVCYFRQIYSVVTLLIVHVHNSLVFFRLWIIGNIIMPLIEQITTMCMIRISNYQKYILRLSFEKIINRINSLDTSRTTIEIYEVLEKKEIVEMPNINYLLTLYVSIFPLLVSI